jgi:hypothetical protein
MPFSGSRSHGLTEIAAVMTIPKGGISAATRRRQMKKNGRVVAFSPRTNRLSAKDGAVGSARSLALWHEFCDALGKSRLHGHLLLGSTIHPLSSLGGPSRNPSKDEDNESPVNGSSGLSRSVNDAHASVFD